MIKAAMYQLLFGRVPFVAPALPAPAVTLAPAVSKLRIKHDLVAKSAAPPVANRQIAPYEPPPGVVPPLMHDAAMALDSSPYDYMNTSSVFIGERFRGYPYLALQSQGPEYRKMSETIAKQMVRKWIEVVSTGDEDKSDKIALMEKALKRFKVRELFYEAAQLDGFFGRGQIYIDVNKPGGQTPARIDPDELTTPLLRSPAKIPKGALRGLTLVEPVWTYPNAYNSNDPLAPDYYKPSSWFIMGKVVHSSRLLHFVSRPVPDMLKAAYNFGGLSLTQLAEPSVNNWIRTRDSVADMVHSFSLCGIKSNLGADLSGNGAGGGMLDRADLFTNIKDNRGLLMLDKDSEEYFQHDTPLSGLADLQSQAQEQPAAVANIPLVFLLGITPSGMNATSEGEIEVFHSYILSMQETLFAENLNRVFQIIQLNEFGDIDEDITFKFLPMVEMDRDQSATIQKTKAETDAVLINSGVIAPDEARNRIASDDESDYAGLPGNAPEPVTEDDSDDDQP